MKNNNNHYPYHHIASINKGEAVAHKGNLYLGGVAAFKKADEIKISYKIVTFQSLSSQGDSSSISKEESSIGVEVISK